MHAPRLRCTTALPTSLRRCCSAFATDTPPPLALGGSIFPAKQNFLLAIRASGLGACVTGWHVDAEAEFRSALDVPDQWRLAGLVIVGWPAGKHGPLRRRPVREVASLDRWGPPLDR